jgi:hypothetical protein
MELAIVLSLAASLCTATASICQRIGDAMSAGGLVVLAIGVWTLSGSWLIIGAESGRADCKPGESGERATQELIRRSS